MGIGLELYGLKKDGSEFPVEISLSWYETEEGRLALGAVRDVTERKQAETVIRAGEQRLVVLMDSLPVLISYVGSDQRYRIVNRAYEVWFGHGRGEIQGKYMWEVLGASAYEAIKGDVEAILSGQTVAFERVVPYQNGGPRHVEAVYVPHFGEQGQVEGFFVLVGDVTEQKRLEKQIQEQHAELAHLARLDVASEMASQLAHELKQPLTAIHAYAQTCLHMLLSGKAPPEQLTDALEEVLNQNQRASEIIRRLRDFIRKTTAEKGPVDINALVQEAVSLANVEIREHQVQLQLDLTSSLPPVSIDSIQIQQVMVNLIRNAIEAMQTTEIGQRVLTVRTSLVDKDWIEVAVHDQGSGLPPEIEQQLFQPFFTTKPSGTGLGLSISRSIIETHGGQLRATSNSDQGATFHFTLPCELRELPG